MRSTILQNTYFHCTQNSKVSLSSMRYCHFLYFNSSSRNTSLCFSVINKWTVVRLKLGLLSHGHDANDVGLAHGDDVVDVVAAAVVVVAQANVHWTEE